MSDAKSCADATQADNYNMAIAASFERESCLRNGGGSLEAVFAEDRHREQLWVLDRIATAIEAGNLAFTQTADRL